MLNAAPYSVSDVGLARKHSLRWPAAYQGVLLGPHFQKERKPERAEGEVGLSEVPGKTQPHPQGASGAGMTLQSHPELQQWSPAYTRLHPSVIGCRLLPWDRMWLGAPWLSSVEEIPKVAES